MTIRLGGTQTPGTVPMHGARPRLPLVAILMQIAIGVTLAPAACMAADEAAPAAAADEPPAGPAGVGAATVGTASLEGVDWVLLAYRSGDALVELEDPHGPARLRFEGGRVTGSAGCNRLMGDYELKGEGIRFQAPMASTMMACPEPLMSQEQAVHAALASVASYRREADGLDLLDPHGEVLLRLAVLEPVALVGPVWQLEAYNNGKQAIVSPLAGTGITLELRDNGTLGGSDGCNRYMSGFTLVGGTLTFGPIATTRMACRGPEGAAEQAAAYAAALGTVTGYRIEGEALVLLNREGGSAARFRVEH